MSARVFEQANSWLQNEDIANTTIEKFAILAKNIYASLKSIESEHASFFNAQSQKPITNFISEFEQAYKNLVKICYNEKNIKENKQFYDFYTKNLKADFIIKNEEGQKQISPVYYNQMMPYISQIFAIEDACSKVVKKLWKSQMTPIKNYDPNKSFNLLIKIVADWRTEVQTPIQAEYMENRLASSCSLVTHEKIEKFNMGSDYGLVYDLQDGFLGAYDGDAFLEEFVYGYNALHRAPMNPLHRIYLDEKHEVITSTPTTTITTPNQVIRLDNFDFNEVIVDSTKAKPCAVFYLSYGQKFLCSDLENAKHLSNELSLPLKEIKYININHCVQNDFSNPIDKQNFKARYDRLPIKEKLKLHISKKTTFAKVYFMDTITNLYVDEKHKSKISYNETLEVASLIIDKNPQTPEDLNNAIVSYLKQNYIVKKHLAEQYLPHIREGLLQGNVSISSNETKNLEFEF